MDWVGIAAVIGALGTIILGVVTALIVPAQNARLKRKELEFDTLAKINDRKIERMFEIEEGRNREYQCKLSDSYSHIYGNMWSLLLNIDADRVCILQPHPHDNREFISISHEILNPKSGVSKQKYNFQYRRMSEWGDVVGMWTSREFIVYKDAKDIKDVKLHAESYRRGAKSVIFRRIANTSGHWLGTLAIDFVHKQVTNMDNIRPQINDVVRIIADILPPYTPPKELNN